MRRKDQWTSSLPFEMSLYFGARYTWVYIVLTLILFVWKGTQLPYEESTFGWEVAFVVMYIFVDAVRHYVGTKGNKLELLRPLVFFLVLSAGILTANVYYMALQMYVLQLDYILGAIMLAINCIQILLACFTMYSVKRVHSFG